MPKKILIDLSYIRTKPNSGVAKYAYRIIDYIVQSGRVDRYALLLDIISADVVKRRYPQFESNIIGNKIVAKVPIFRTYWLQYSFKNIVNSSDYNVVFCPWANQITCLKSKKKIVSVIHDLQSLIDWKGVAMYRDRHVFNNVIRNSYKIVTISKFSKQQIESIYPSATVDNLSNSVSMDSYNLPERMFTYPYILFVGRICKMKNILTLVRCFLRISKRHEELRLVVVGQKNKYWEKVIMPIIKGGRIENKVELLSGVSEKQLSALYRDAEIFVFPSLREGFGYPPVEASIMGTPVVSSKADSLEEVSLGLWFTYENPLDDTELADVINRVLKAPPTKDDLTHIKEEMLKHYSPFNVCRHICDYIEKI